MPKTLARFPLTHAVPLRPVLPAVTMTAQASMLTGRRAGNEVSNAGTTLGHGIVANGWLYRDTMEVRFWQQSNRLLQSEPIYAALKRRYQELGESFHVAKLFWWFNQGAAVDLAVTPKPHYGSDGSKVFDIDVFPREAKPRFKDLGPFPFASFWGPMSGQPASDWIANLATRVIATGIELIEPKSPSEPFDLTLVYLPHLDYDPQRFGPTGVDLAKCAAELDEMIEGIVAAAKTSGAEVWLVSEYGHVDVSRPVYLNRWLRDRGLVIVRDGPFGETLDTFESRAFAVVDHQLAHVYVRDPSDVAQLSRELLSVAGVADAAHGADRNRFGLDHARSGEIVLLAQPDAWFAYPYWTDDDRAPDFARSVDIHRKPGFDPCEMFFDRKLLWPKGKVAWRLLQKTLGFRTRFDVISLDTRLVRGSHGLIPPEANDYPVLVTEAAIETEPPVELTDIHRLLLDRFAVR